MERPWKFSFQKENSLPSERNQNYVHKQRKCVVRVDWSGALCCSAFYFPFNNQTIDSPFNFRKKICISRDIQYPIVSLETKSSAEKNRWNHWFVFFQAILRILSTWDVFVSVGRLFIWIVIRMYSARTKNLVNKQEFFLRRPFPARLRIITCVCRSWPACMSAFSRLVTLRSALTIEKHFQL